MGGYLDQQEIDSILRDMKKKMNHVNEEKKHDKEEKRKTPLVEKVAFAPLKPYRLDNFKKPDISFFDNISLVVSGELGSAEITVSDLLKLEEGSVIKLDKIAGESAAILINGRHIGQAEVVVINERFGLRITAIGNGDTELAKEG